MRKMDKKAAIAIIVFLAAFLFFTPDNCRAEMEWTTYLNSNDINCVAVEGNFVFCGTFDGGLVRWNRNTGEYRLFTIHDGLQSNNVWNATVDGRGWVWFSYFIDTELGVSCFTGESIETWTTARGLAGNVVHDILTDSSGNIWVATSGGLSRFDGAGWVNYTEDDFAKGVNYLALYKDGCIIAATSASIWRLDGDTWNMLQFFGENGVNRLSVGPDGTLWLTTNAGFFVENLVSFDGNTWTTWDLTDDTGYGVFISNRGFEPDGTIWFTLSYSHPQILEYVSIRNRIVTKYSDMSEMPIYILDQQATDEEGISWIATGDGLLRFDGTSSTVFTIPGPPKNRIPAITLDSDGSLWCATFGGGVGVFRDGQWKKYARPDGLPNNKAWSVVCCPDGSKWVSTWGGIGRFDGKNWETLHPDPDNEKGGGLAVGTDSTIWYSGNGWVANYVNKDWNNYDIGSGDAITVDASGTVWVGCGNGVAKKTSDGWLTYSYKTCDILNGFVRCICSDKEGRIWIGMSNGISCFDGVSWTNYTSGNGDIPNTEIYSLAVDQNNILWAGTSDSGVLAFDGKNWRHFDKSDGLMDNKVISISCAPDGTIWFGTFSGGLTQFRGDIFPPVVNNDKFIPQEFSLSNYPNPFNPSTTIDFSIPADSRVMLKIYNIAGQEVATLKNEMMSAGSHSVVWNAEGMPSGVYFCRLKTGSTSQTGKMMILK